MNLEITRKKLFHNNRFYGRYEQNKDGLMTRHMI